MNKMNKLIYTLATLLLAFSLIACGSAQTQTQTPNDAKDGAATNTATGENAEANKSNPFQKQKGVNMERAEQDE